MSAMDVGDFCFDDALDQMITEQEALGLAAVEPPPEAEVVSDEVDELKLNEASRRGTGGSTSSATQ